MRSDNNVSINETKIQYNIIQYNIRVDLLCSFSPNFHRLFFLYSLVIRALFFPMRPSFSYRHFFVSSFSVFLAYRPTLFLSAVVFTLTLLWIYQSVKTYIAPLQDTYLETLPTQAKRKRTVLRRWWNWEQAPFGRCLSPFQVFGPTTENERVCIVYDSTYTHRSRFDSESSLDLP